MNGSLINKKIAAAIRELPNNGAGRYIIAVSGGPDSQCLLKAFPHVLREATTRPSETMGAPWSFARCEAVAVDHGLRKEAAEEVELARQLAESQGVRFTKLSLKVERGPNLQARAREARYEALRAFAGSKVGTYIVTAHHFEDRAETVLIRLLRGKNIGSLAVMPRLTGQVFRPMLDVRKAEIEDYLRRWKVPFASDPSNADPRYLRTRVRREILPILEKASPRIRERLNSLADEALAQKDVQAESSRRSTTSHG